MSSEAFNFLKTYSLRSVKAVGQCLRHEGKLTFYVSVLGLLKMHLHILDCPPENGYCLKPNGLDQNRGVHKLNGINGNTKQAQESCLQMCKRYSGATGCEVIWNRWNRGCYVHTLSIARGNGRSHHTCWVFSKCRTTTVNVHPSK